MPSLSKYIKASAFIPFIITVNAGIILSLTHGGSSYKSEWFTNDGFVMTIEFTILLSGLISLLSLTLLLNRQPIVKNTLLLSFIAWFLLPGIVCIFIIYQEALNFTGYTDIDGRYEGNRLLDGYIMSMAILYLLSLFVTYIHFRLTSNTTTNKNSH